MSSFFGLLNYAKPGPGVEKDAPPKPRAVTFLNILSRKFWNLAKLNMMFTVFNIPAIIAAFYLAHIFLPQNITDDVFNQIMQKFLFAALFLCVPAITVGPAQAGFTYVLRNYSRQEHAFIWSDFKEHAVKNLKDSMIISLIDFLAVFVIGIDFNICFSFSKTSALMLIATGLLLGTLIFFLIMHMYIYPMLVTFKLSVKQIYKNAFILTLIKFVPNFGIWLLCTAILVATFWVPTVGILLFPFMTMSIIGLLTNYFVYPQLEKYIADRNTTKETPAGDTV